MYQTLCQIASFYFKLTVFWRFQRVWKWIIGLKCVNGAKYYWQDTLHLFQSLILIFSYISQIILFLSQKRPPKYSWYSHIMLISRFTNGWLILRNIQKQPPEVLYQKKWFLGIFNFFFTERTPGDCFRKSAMEISFLLDSYQIYRNNFFSLFELISVRLFYYCIWTKYYLKVNPF